MAVHGRYIAALLSVDVVLLAAMCIVHFPRASHFYTPELVSGVLVDVDHVACDYGRLEFVTRVLGGYHALIAVSACVTSFKARKMGSQCKRISHAGYNIPFLVTLEISGAKAQHSASPPIFPASSFGTHS